jgi:hypothetical protein
MWVFVPIPTGQQLFGFDNITGLLTNLSLDRFGGALPNLGPSAGQRPPSVFPLANQKEPIGSNTAPLTSTFGVAYP